MNYIDFLVLFSHLYDDTKNKFKNIPAMNIDDLILI